MIWLLLGELHAEWRRLRGVSRLQKTIAGWSYGAGLYCDKANKSAAVPIAGRAAALGGDTRESLKCAVCKNRRASAVLRVG